MKKFQKTIILGLIVCLFVWGGIALYYTLATQDKFNNTLNPELEKLHYAFYQTLNNQTRSIEHEIERQGIAEMVSQGDNSQFYNKKLELVLDRIMYTQGLHILSIISPDGNTFVRGSNPLERNDLVYSQNYDHLNPPAAKLQDLISFAENGRIISSIELLPKTLLDKEFATIRVEDGRLKKFPLSEISEMIYQDRDGNPLTVDGETRETRGLAQLSLIPIRNKDETIAILIGARLLSKETKILYTFHRTSDSGIYHPTISVNGMRIATTLPIDGGPLKGRPAINTFLDSNPKNSFQTPIFDYHGNLVAQLNLEEPPIKWATTPPPQTMPANFTKMGPTNIEIKKSFDSVTPPWIPLGLLLIAFLLGFIALLIVVATLKELTLTFGNVIKRSYYLKQIHQKIITNNMRHKIKFSLKNYNKHKANISEQELAEFTSSLLKESPDATPSP